jgi:hypothetical protein
MLGRDPRRPELAPPACPNCRRPLQLEARTCRGCERAVAFDPLADAFLDLDPANGGWAGADRQTADVQPCNNSRYGACNWLVLDGHASGLCPSCRHNAIIPDLTAPGVLQRWRRVEDAKRRAIRGLLRLGLSLEGEPPLAFHLLYDPAAEAGGPPMHPTGYLEGVVTLNLVEADDSARERIRAEMAEPYRTLVGHFRHELGHHFWRRLVAGSRQLQAFRDLFGDERADYGGAAQAYYAAGGVEDWSARFVSRYASMHPWEDFAETFAHFLHIVDALAALRDFDMTLASSGDAPAPSRLAVEADPYACATATLAGLWPYFAFALNAINRSMGQPDVYPFALGPLVVLKLDFINRLVADAAGRATFGDGERPGLEAVIAVLGAPADSSDEPPPSPRPAS